MTPKRRHPPDPTNSTSYCPSLCVPTALFPEPVFILFTLPLTFETHALNLLKTQEVLEDLMIIGGVGGGCLGEGLNRRLDKVEVGQNEALSLSW